MSVEISPISSAAVRAEPHPRYFGFLSAKRKVGRARYSAAPHMQAPLRLPANPTATDFNRKGRKVGTDEISNSVIGAALEVHRALGPGLLESTYDLCLAEEFRRRELGFERQYMVPVTYGDLLLPSAYRVDYLVEEQVIVELKSVAGIDPVHIAQVLTYLKLSGCTVGLLINFNVILLRDGIRRVVLNHTDSLRSLRLKSR